MHTQSLFKQYRSTNRLSIASNDTFRYLLARFAIILCVIHVNLICHFCLCVAISSYYGRGGVCTNLSLFKVKVDLAYE